MILLEEGERGGSRTEHWPWGPGPNPSRSQASPAELGPRAAGEGAGEGGRGAGSRPEMEEEEGPSSLTQAPQGAGQSAATANLRPRSSVPLYRGGRAGLTGRREAAASPTRKVRVKQK